LLDDLLPGRYGELDENKAENQIYLKTEDMCILSNNFFMQHWFPFAGLQTVTCGEQLSS